MYIASPPKLQLSTITCLPPAPPTHQDIDSTSLLCNMYGGENVCSQTMGGGCGLVPFSNRERQNKGFYFSKVELLLVRDHADPSAMARRRPRNDSLSLSRLSCHRMTVEINSLSLFPLQKAP